jgi:hypothetical protein
MSDLLEELAPTTDAPGVSTGSADTKVAQLAPFSSDATKCAHCGKPFEPRKGSGGKAQKFCSPDCRRAFHADAQRGQRSPTCSAPIASPAVHQPVVSKSGPRCLLAAQDPITVERDNHGNLVLRQSCRSDVEDVIVVRRDYEQQFLDALSQEMGIPSFGGPR